MSSWHQLERQQQEACWWPCCGCTAAELPYYFNGRNSSGTSSAVAQSYDIGGDSYTSQSAPTTDLVSMASGHDDCYVYSIGGGPAASTFSSDVYKIDKATITPVSSTSYPYGYSHNIGNDACNDSNGLNVFGGMDSTFTVSSKHYALGAAWSSLTDMPSVRQGSLTTSLGAGKTHIIAGKETSVSTPVDKNVLYDSGGDSFSSKTAMTAARLNGSGFNDASDLINWCGGASALDNYQYSSSGDSWSTKTALSAIRSLHYGTSPMSHAFVAGGTTNGTGGGSLQTTEEYSFGGDSWSTKSNLPNKQYSMGGGT